MAESYSVEAVLSAVDSRFSSTFAKAAKTVDSVTSQVGNSLEKIGKVSTVAGAVVTAMGVKSLKSFGDFQASLNKAAVVAGGTSKNIGELADVANRMGAELPLSAQDAADAMVQMAQDGASIDTIKDEFPAIAKAATAAGSDLQSTAGVVQIAMNIWGDSIGSSAQAAAVLTTAANVSNASIEDMQQAFADVGSIASQTGNTMQDTATAIGMITNSGLPAAQAAQDLNFAITKMIKPSKQAAEMAESLGISYYDSAGKMKPLPQILREVGKATDGMNDKQKQLALTTMFGTAGFKAMSPLLKSMTNESGNASQSWSAMSKAINDASSSSAAANKVLDEQAKDMQQNLGSALEQVGGNWEALRNSAMQSASGVNSAILDMINRVLTLANQSDSSFGKMAQSFIGLSAIIGPVLLILGQVAGSFNAIRLAMTPIVAAANLIAVGIAALAAMLALAYAKSEAFRNAVSNIGGAFTKVFGPASSIIQSVINKISELATALGDKLASVLNSIDWALAFTTLKTAISTTVGVVKGFASVLNGMFKNDIVRSTLIGIGTAALSIATGFKIGAAAINAYTAIVKIGTAIQTAFNAVMAVNPFVLITIALAALVAGLVYFFTQTESGKAIWASFTAFLTSTWQATVATAQAIWSALSAFFSGLWAGIASVATSVWNGIVASLGGIWDGLISYASGAFNLLKAVILGPILLLIDLVTGDFDNMKSDVTLIWNSIKDAAGQIWNGLVAIVTGIVSNFVSGVSVLFNSMVSIVVGIWNGLKSTVVSIAKAIASGAISAWDGMVAGVKKVISRVSSAFNSLSQINLFSIGKNIVQGLINGISEMIGSVKDKISELASTVTNGIRKALKIHSPSRVMAELGMYTGMGFSNGIEGTIPVAQKISEKLANAAMVTIPAINQSPFNASLKSLNNQLQTTSLDASLDVNYSKSLTVEVPVNIDGREVARVTAQPMRQELDRMDRNANRLNGIRI